MKCGHRINCIEEIWEEIPTSVRIHLLQVFTWSYLLIYGLIYVTLNFPVCHLRWFFYGSGSIYLKTTMVTKPNHNTQVHIIDKKSEALSGFGSILTNLWSGWIIICAVASAVGSSYSSACIKVDIYMTCVAYIWPIMVKGNYWEVLYELLFLLW